VPNGGQVEVLANGELCTECGVIETYRPSAMPRSMAFVRLPDSLPNDPTLSLRIKGTQHPNSTGTFFLFEGAEIFNGSFVRLSYADAAVNNGSSLWEATASFEAPHIVPRALPGAVYGDVHAFANHAFTSNLPFSSYSFATTHNTLGLILARSPQGGRVIVEYYATDSTYKTLTTVDLNSVRTTPREMIVVQRPVDAEDSSGLWYLRVRGEVIPQQTGGTLNFIFVDGFVGFGAGYVGRWYPTRHSQRDSV
jgi:hypothetical protein